MTRWLACCLLAWPAAAEVRMEAMTSPEIARARDAGARTVIVPTGGTEQNGQFLAVGKHQRIVTYNATRIAEALGDVLVAPTIPTVPEGSVAPPEGHMRFAGTLSVRRETFEALLEDTARSYRAHGFRLICFLGDHGGSQSAQHHVAKKLTAEWADEGVRVLQVEAYYETPRLAAFGRARGIGEPPSAHAGYYDGSQLMAVAPEDVRPLRSLSAAEARASGSGGAAGSADRRDGEALLRLRQAAATDEIAREQRALGMRPTGAETAVRPVIAEEKTAPRNGSENGIKRK